MINDIELIQQMLEANNFDLPVLQDILAHYQDYPAILPYRLFAGEKIIRSSTNDLGEFHENVQRLSYPPPKYARTDRASLKGKPMFYGTIFTTAATKNNAYPRIISALETTDILRDFQQEGRVFTTQSLWLPDRDLHLFSFPFSKSYKKPCEEICWLWNVWDADLSRRWPKQYKEFSEYIGDLMARENFSCLYEITANTIDFILYNSVVAKDLDGIMYPSVWGAGEGMNICLKKEVVDECVHFQAASVQCIDKAIGESLFLGVAESYMLSDGTLKWTPTAEALRALTKEYGVEEVLKKRIIYFEDIKK